MRAPDLQGRQEAVPGDGCLEERGARHLGVKTAAAEDRHRDQGPEARSPGWGGHSQQAKCQDSICLILKMNSISGENR